MTLFKWALLCSRTDSRCFQMDHHQVSWICPCTLKRISKSELLQGFAFILNWYAKLLLLFWYSFCHLRHTCFLFVCFFGVFLFVFFSFCVCLGFFRLPFENGLYLFSAFTLAFFGKKPLRINQIPNT